MYNEIMKKYSYYLRFIAIVSLFAILLNIMRLSLSNHVSYVWMNWNLALGLIPLVFAWLARIAKQRWVAVLMVVAWLLILPNAPYMITDLIHIGSVGPASIRWFDAIMLLSYSLAGLGVWVLTMDSLRQKFNWPAWSVWVVALLTGYGIYLGRYIRFNTWDIFTRPLSILGTVLETITQSSAHKPVIMMTLVFTGLLGFLYFALISPISNEKK